MVQSNSIDHFFHFQKNIRKIQVFFLSISIQCSTENLSPTLSLTFYNYIITISCQHALNKQDNKTNSYNFTKSLQSLYTIFKLMPYLFNMQQILFWHFQASKMENRKISYETGKAYK